METKIKKINSKYEVVIGDTIEQYGSLEKAEKRVKSLNKSELDGYLLRKDYQGKKLIETYFIG